MPDGSKLKTIVSNVRLGDVVALVIDATLRRLVAPSLSREGTEHSSDLLTRIVCRPRNSCTVAAYSSPVQDWTRKPSHLNRPEVTREVVSYPTKYDAG